jgi:hypothetical protein
VQHLSGTTDDARDRHHQTRQAASKHAIGEPAGGNKGNGHHTGKVRTAHHRQETASSAPRRRFTAIARLHGSLIAEDNQLWLVATDDGARFRVQAVRPGSLTMQLLTLEPIARIGLFGFWPTSKGDIILSAFFHHDKFDSWVPNPDSPHPDESDTPGKAGGLMSVTASKADAPPKVSDCESFSDCAA